MRRNAGSSGWCAVLVAVWLVTAESAFGWGASGHRTVGAIADHLIAGRRAETEVHKLLLSGESLQSVSMWADCAKGHCGQLTPELSDFVRRNPRHARYHYTDVPFEAVAYEERGVGASDDDIVHISKQCIAVLKGATDRAANPHDFNPRQALLLLVHLLGDIHQPLHVGTAYVSDKGAFVVPGSRAAADDVTIFKTNGDNDIIFESSSLHEFWDIRAVESSMQHARVWAPEEFAALLMHAPPDIPIVTGDVTKWPAKWATETLGVSRRAHEGLRIQGREEGPERGRTGRFRWRLAAPADYAQSASTLASSQLTRAGYRLAAVLEAVWH